MAVVGGGGGTPLETLLQQLMRAASEDELRTAASKVSSCVQTVGPEAGRSMCDLLLAPDNHLADRYIATMKVASDTQTLGHLTSILNESLKDKDCSGAVARRLAEVGGAEAVLAALRALAHTGHQHQTTAALYGILNKVGRKDERFAVRLRLCGGLKVVLRSLQEGATRARVSVPLLQVLKLAADNEQNSVVLGRGESVEYLCRLVPHLWNMSGLKQQLTVESLAKLTRNRSNRRRLLREPVLPRLLALLQPRQQLEKRTLFNLQRAVLSVAFMLAELKSGRELLLDAKVLDVMQTFLRRCPSPERHDRLFCRAANTALRCVSKWSLPVSRMESPVKFVPPEPQPEQQSESGQQSQAELATGDGPAPAPDTVDSGSETETEGTETETEGTEPRLVETHAACVPEPVRTPAAQLLRCAPFFPELAGPAAPSPSPPASPRGTPLASPRGTPPEKSAGCQCLPRCLTRLCRQRAAAPQPESTAPPGMAWRARLPQTAPDQRAQGDAPPTYRDVYRRLAQGTRHLAPFVKLAYPELVGAEAVVQREPLGACDRLVCRRKVQGLVDDALGQMKSDNKVVYDYDLLVSSFGKEEARYLDNFDEKKVSSILIDFNEDTSLRFESRFESGNLRRAIRTGPHEYDLLICPDVGSSRHQQWFYFEVSNMRAHQPYVFNIINNEKLTCEYQSGMRPVLFSVKEAVLGHPCWTRVGTDLFYYRNAYCRPARHSGKRQPASQQSARRRVYCTASFTITFPHEGDVCYLAFHYPYTYTRLRTLLDMLERSMDPEVWWRCEPLACDLGGNSAHLVTVTGHGTLQHKKEVVFLTARIHPGETGASWAMEGTLRFLVGGSAEARSLRHRFIFKIVPMLNVEGVVNGCHRCGLTDEDLNRRWKTPDPVLHPVIYRTKALMEYSAFVLKRVPYLFCDYHGHSCRKNVFLYGCSGRRSWLAADRAKPDNEALVSCLPQALYRVAPAFSLRCCHLAVERSRESTARVVIWRELGVQRSYTMESSYCGCDQGPYQDCAISTQQLQETGGRLCLALHLVSVPGDLAALEAARTTYWWRPQEEFEREFQLSSASNSDATESDDDTDAKSAD